MNICQMTFRFQFFSLFSVGDFICGENFNNSQSTQKYLTQSFNATTSSFRYVRCECVCVFDEESGMSNIKTIHSIWIRLFGNAISILIMLLVGESICVFVLGPFAFLGISLDCESDNQNHFSRLRPSIRNKQVC